MNRESIQVMDPTTLKAALWASALMRQMDPIGRQEPVNRSREKALGAGGFLDHVALSSGSGLGKVSDSGGTGLRG